MNRNQFLAELRTKLQNLPDAEVDSALSYYEEYIIEAGPENEEQVIAELGTPNAIAAKIIGEFALSETAPAATQTSSSKTLWIVILALIASPIAFPLALAAIALIFALLIVMLVLPFTFAVTGAALVAAGIAGFFTGLVALFVHFGTGVFQIGFGLLAAGIGTLFVLGAIKAFDLIFKGLHRMLGSFLVRKAA